MSTARHISDEFKQTVGSEIDLISEGRDRYVISTPFTFDDGDEFAIVLRKEGGDWFLTDEAHTFMHLSYEMDERDWQRGNRAEIIEKALLMFDVQEEGGELRRRVEGRRFGDALFDYVQALSRIADVGLLSREIIRSTFLEDFRQTVIEVVPQDRRVFGWSDPVHDPNGIYPVDVRVNQMDVPLFVYALHSNERVKDATISLLKFEQWNMPHHSVGVFENIGEISDRELARFMDVAGKLFSSLSGSRDRFAEYLEEHLR